MAGAVAFAALGIFGTFVVSNLDESFNESPEPEDPSPGRSGVRTGARELGSRHGVGVL
jgi:hypothetical protein